MPSLTPPLVPMIYLASKSLCDTEKKFWVKPGLPENPRGF